MGANEISLKALISLTFIAAGEVRFLDKISLL